MKILATIALSLVAIVAALVLTFSSMCAFTEDRKYLEFSIICGAVSLAVLVVTVWAIARLSRMRDGDQGSPHP
jgi:hypothetical protein